MDLSKSFDSLNQELLFAKRKAYGLDNNSAMLMRSYVRSKVHRCKINCGKTLAGNEKRTYRPTAL